MSKNQETKEEFCGACVAGITAIAGIGTAEGIKNTNAKRKTKKIVFYLSLIVTIISILIILYLLFIKKCDQCIE